MQGHDYILYILQIIAFIAFIVGTGYWMCRTCFDWRKAGYLAAFLFFSGFIWYYYSKSSAPNIDSFNAVCKSYGNGINECNGWLFTSETPYNLAIAAKKWMSDTELARGQALIAGVFIVIMSLLQYSQAVVQKSIQALVMFTITSIVTYLILTNISEIQKHFNHYYDFMLSFGKYNHDESYTKLSKTFQVFDKIKKSSSDWSFISLESTITEYFAMAAGVVFKGLYYFLSYVNIGMFMVQGLSLMFLPSILAMGILNTKYSIRRPLVIIGYTILGRIFIVAQMTCINQLNISPEFGTLVGTDASIIIDFFFSYMIAVGSLVISAISMVIYVIHLIYTQVLSPKAQALV